MNEMGCPERASKKASLSQSEVASGGPAWAGSPPWSPVPGQDVQLTSSINVRSLGFSLLDLRTIKV